jgi:hypothetical protein
MKMPEAEEENRQDAKSAKGTRTKEERRRRAPGQPSFFDSPNENRQDAKNAKEKGK